LAHLHLITSDPNHVLTQNDKVLELSKKHELTFLTIRKEAYWKEPRLLDLSATIQSKGKTEKEWIGFFTEFSRDYSLCSDEAFVQICSFRKVDSLLASRSEVFAVLSVPTKEIAGYVPSR